MADERDDRGELRLLDVLLEQEFARARSDAPVVEVNRARSRWLAAALLLLGVGVVIGVVVLRRGGGEARVVPVQQPQGEEKGVDPQGSDRLRQLVERALNGGGDEAGRQLLQALAVGTPKDREELQRLLDEQFRLAHQGAPVAPTKRIASVENIDELDQLLTRVLAIRALDRPPMQVGFTTLEKNEAVRPWTVIRSRDVAADELEGWIVDLKATIRGKPGEFNAVQDPPATDLDIALQLANGDELTSGFVFGTEPRVLFPCLSKSFTPTPGLLTRMLELRVSTRELLFAGTAREYRPTTPVDPDPSKVESIDISQLGPQDPNNADAKVVYVVQGRALPELLALTRRIRVLCLTHGESPKLIADAEATISDPEEVKAFCDLVPAMEGNAGGDLKPIMPNDPPGTSRLEFQLADGRRMTAHFRLGEQPTLVLPFLQPVDLKSAAFITKLTDLRDRAENNGFLARGRGRLGTAHTLAEVQDMLPRVQRMVISPKPEPNPGYGFDRSVPVPAAEFAGWMQDLRATIDGKAFDAMSDSDFTFTLYHANGDLDGGMLALTPEPRLQFFGVAKSFAPTPSLLARMRALKTPARDPAKLIAFAENVDDMDKLLRKVKSITAMGGGFDLVDSATGKVTPSHTFDARTAVVIQDVNGWATDLRASLRGEAVTITPGEGLRFTLALADGRALSGTLMLSEHPSVHLANLPTPFAPSASLLARMQWLFSKAKAVQDGTDKPDFGVANHIDDLPKVPADVKALRCPSPRASTVREQLRRFAALENLELVVQGMAESPHGDIIAELAQLTTLHRLRLPGRMLYDADADLLATMPTLTALRLDGGLRGLTERGMATLLRGKQSIELVDVENVAVVAVVRAAAAAGTMRRFAVFGDVDDATLAAIVTLPGLEALGLGGVWCKDEHIAQLLITKLQELRLEYADVTAAGLFELGKIATLRTLDLRRMGLPQKFDALLLQQALPQVRIIWPMSPPESPSLDDVPGATRK